MLTLVLCTFSETDVSQCPWVGSCSGYHNYRFFYLFVVYLAVECWYISTLACYVVLGQRYRTDSQAWSGKAFSMSEHQRLMYFEENHRRWSVFVLVLTGAVAIALTCLGGFHTYLIVTNQTNVEFIANYKQRKLAKKRGEVFTNVYDLGWVENIQETLGYGRWLFVSFTPLAQLRSDDGAQFKTVFNQFSSPMTWTPMDGKQYNGNRAGNGDEDDRQLGCVPPIVRESKR